MLVKSLPVNHLSTTYSLTSEYFSLHDNKIAPPYVVGIFIFHLSLEQTPKPRVCCHILGYKKKEVAQWHLQSTYWMVIYTSRMLIVLALQEKKSRLICSFEMEPPSEKQAVLFELLNDVNEKCWAGSFSFWTEQKMMIYKYGLVLTGGQIASAEQVDCLISTAVLSSEKFYPAFQLAVYGDKSPKEAIQVAIAEAFGRA